MIHPFNYRLFSIFILAFVFFGITQCSSSRKVALESRWITTWSTAPQLVEPHNMPPQPGLTGNTLRQRFRISKGGDSIRFRFSNEFSKSPLTLKTVEIAIPEDSSTVDSKTIKTLTFQGNKSITIPTEQAILSDAIAFPLKNRADVAVTIFYGNVSEDVTGHPGSRTTSYLLSGNQVNNSQFANAIKTDHWYTINSLEVSTSKESAAIAILGNSITDGRGSGTNKQNRWPDILSERLLADSTTNHIAVINQGIGGNCVTKQCLGPSAISRFQRDVLSQKGVQWLIIFEGVNDIGGTRDSLAAKAVARDLISAYQQMIDKAHEQGIKVFGGTITPFGKSFYYTPFHEEARQIVNNWIRTSGYFDGIIDFDKALENPEELITILPDLHTGDYLHPSEKGHKVLGEAVNLNLFK